MNAINTKTILLVEDEEDDVLFVTMALQKVNAATGLRVVEDGGEAIEYLSGIGKFGDRTLYPLPALVLLDLKLPRVMGMDVLRWIRSRPEFDMMLVIMLTSSQQRSDIEAACSLRANSYLVKPSDPLELTEMMGLVTRYWLGLNQPTATLLTPVHALPR